jgi:hypothetical protein
MADSHTIAADASTPAVAKSFGAGYLSQLANVQIDT